jgi:hypothetical protein
MTDLRLKLASTLPALKLQISQPSLKARLLPGIPGPQGLPGSAAVIPAVSADNTVPRFDGTEGALQTSGVVIDDSDRIQAKGFELKTSLLVGSANPIRIEPESGNNTSYIGLAANGYEEQINFSGDGSYASKKVVGHRHFNISRTATSGTFYNPANLPIVDDADWTEYSANITFATDQQFVLNTSYQSCTPTVAAQAVTAVTVSPDLTGYSASQTVGWVAWQSGTIYAQGTVQATAGGVINTAQFAAAIGLPTAAIFTATPLILVQPPNMAGGTAILDVVNLKLSRQPPNVYPAPNSYLYNLMMESYTGAAGVKGPFVEYVGIAGIVESPATGLASGIIDFRRIRNGAMHHVYLGGGFYIPTVTTDKGVGTLNLSQLWEAGNRVVAQDAGGNVGLGGQLTATNNIQVTKGSATPELSTFRSDAHGNAAISRVAMYGKDSASNVELFGLITTEVTDNTNGSEDAKVEIQTSVAGTLARRFSVSDRVSFVGTPTNDNATAGDVGEIISSAVETGAAVALTNGVAANVTSISLTAGDWDVTGVVHLQGNAATTVSNAFASVSGTSATLSNTAANASQIWSNGNTIFAAATYVSVPPITRRVTIASTTTHYLVALAAFGVSTCAAFGYIQARRAR